MGSFFIGYLFGVVAGHPEWMLELWQAMTLANGLLAFWWFVIASFTWLLLVPVYQVMRDALKGHARV